MTRRILLPLLSALVVVGGAIWGVSALAQTPAAPSITGFSPVSTLTWDGSTPIKFTVTASPASPYAVIDGTNQQYYRMRLVCETSSPPTMGVGSEDCVLSGGSWTCSLANDCKMSFAGGVVGTGTVRAAVVATSVLLSKGISYDVKSSQSYQITPAPPPPAPAPAPAPSVPASAVSTSKPCAWYQYLYHLSCWTTGNLPTPTPAPAPTPTPPPPPPPPQPPVISNIRATEVDAQSATISWTTDRATSGFLDYGPTTMYGRTQLSSSGATSHQVVLMDFAEKGTVTYHFRIRARDAEGLESVSADQIFQVPALAAAAMAPTSSAPSAIAPSAPRMSIDDVMNGLQNLESTTTRLLTPEEKSALGFPFRVSIQVRTVTSARAGTRTIFNYTDVVEKDSDFDGLPDDLEDDLGTDKHYEDTDGDGKSDGYEYHISKSDPTKAD